MEFTTELAATGGSTTGFVVPDDVVEALGAGRRPKVVVTVAGHTWRSSIASMGGRMLLGMSRADREAAGVAAGEVHTVTVLLDDAPREVEVPEALATALASDPTAAAFYASLSYSAQRAFAEPVGQARTDETRARRVDKAMAALREGRKRP